MNGSIKDILKTLDFTLDIQIWDQMELLCKIMHVFKYKVRFECQFSANHLYSIQTFTQRQLLLTFEIVLYYPLLHYLYFKKMTNAGENL